MSEEKLDLLLKELQAIKNDLATRLDKIESEQAKLHERLNKIDTGIFDVKTEHKRQDAKLEQVVEGVKTIIHETAQADRKVAELNQALNQLDQNLQDRLHRHENVHKVLNNRLLDQESWKEHVNQVLSKMRAKLDQLFKKSDG